MFVLIVFLYVSKSSVFQNQFSAVVSYIGKVISYEMQDTYLRREENQTPNPSLKSRV